MARPALEILQGGKSVGQTWLRALYEKYGSAVYRRCLFLLKERAAAEDAMQDVFARAMLNETSFRGESSQLTWLLKISTHHCLNVMRANKAAWTVQYARDAQAAGEGHGGTERAEARDWVRRALGRFDAETQAAVIHYYVDEMTLEEVATLLERSVPTVRKRIRQFALATGQTWSET